MNEAIWKRLSASLADTRLDQLDPDRSALDKALKVQGHELSNMATEELTTHMYTLTQYTVFMNMQTNIRRIKFIEAKRDYELALARELSTKQGKTVKERSSAAMLESPELQKLELEMRVREADHILFDNIPDSIAELASAMKKEIGNRYQGNNGRKY